MPRTRVIPRLAHQVSEKKRAGQRDWQQKVGDNLVIPARYHLGMTQGDEPITRYASYLLRLRLVWSDEQPIWIASLENTITGSHRSFPNAEALAAYLLAEYGRRNPVVKDGLQSKEEDHRPLENE